MEVDETLLLWPIERSIIEVPVIRAKVSVLGSIIPEWASGMAQYLDNGKLLEVKEEVRRIKKKMAKFLLMDGVLYKKGFSTLLLRCIFTQEA